MASMNIQLIPSGDNDAVWCIIPVASMPNNAIEVTGDCVNLSFAKPRLTVC